MSESDPVLFLRFSDDTVLADDSAPSRYIHASSGNLVLFDDNSNEIDVGMFETILVDVGSAVNDRVSVFDVFDTQNTTMNFYENLYDLDEDDFSRTVIKTAFVKDSYSYQPNLAILDRLVVYSAWRGKGLGALAIRALSQRLRASVRILALNPYPLQFEREYLEKPRVWYKEQAEAYPKWRLEDFSGNQEEATARLTLYYAKQGFKTVPGTGYMVRDIELL